MATQSKFFADIGLETGQDLLVDGNATVTGNLTVNGTQTTVNSTTTSVADSMIELANSNTGSDTLDIGIYGNYNDGLADGVGEFTGLFRDASDSTWKLFDGLEVEPTTTVNISGTNYAKAALEVGDLSCTTLTATNSLTGASLTYPTSDGTNGQVLTTNGSGTLSFSTISGYTDSDVESYLDGGTSTPTFASAIVDGGTGEGSLYVEGTFSGNPITARLLASDGGAVFFGSNTNHDVRIQTNGTNRMYITTDGTMGFGMSPLGTNNGSAFFDGNVSSKDGFMTTGTDLQLIQPSAANTIFVRDNGNESMRIDSSGQIGIGQTSPNATLDVKGSYASPQALIGYSDGDGLFIHAQGGSTHTNWCIGQQKNLSGLEFTPSTTAGGTTFSNPALAIYPNGDVGIGAGTPSFSTFGSNGGGLEIDDVGSSFSALRVNHSTGDFYIATNAGASYLWQYSNSPIVFGNNNTEYERVDEGGTKFHMTTSGYGTPQYARHWIQFASGSQRGFAFKATSTTSTDTPMIFFNGGAGVAGSITYDYNGTSYNTTSDYRLKENVTDTWDATTRLKQLRPVRFNWIADDTDTLIDGFLAHEVADVVPNAVTGDKDAIEPQVLYTETDYDVINGTANVGEVKDAERIEPQTLDNSKLVPLLVKTIQELEARIATLESA